MTDQVCPTCHGSGMVTRGTDTKPRRGLNSTATEPCIAYFRRLIRPAHTGSHGAGLPPRLQVASLSRPKRGLHTVDAASSVGCMR